MSDGPLLDDDSAAAFFDANADALESADPGQRPSRPLRLTNAIPIRFSEESVAAIKEVAEREGMTVSRWVRNEVEAALRRRGLEEGAVGVISLPIARAQRGSGASRETAEHVQRLIRDKAFAL